MSTESLVFQRKPTFFLSLWLVSAGCVDAARGCVSVDMDAYGIENLTQIGCYELQQKLGAGAFACVRLARHLPTNQEVRLFCLCCCCEAAAAGVRHVPPQGLAFLVWIVHTDRRAPRGSGCRQRQHRAIFFFPSVSFVVRARGQCAAVLCVLLSILSHSGRQAASDVVRVAVFDVRTQQSFSLLLFLT
jgi:serine/threonine protein kinase